MKKIVLGLMCLVSFGFSYEVQDPKYYISYDGANKKCVKTGEWKLLDEEALNNVMYNPLSKITDIDPGFRKVILGDYVLFFFTDMEKCNQKLNLLNYIFKK